MKRKIYILKLLENVINEMDIASEEKIFFIKHGKDPSINIDDMKFLLEETICCL